MANFTSLFSHETDIINEIGTDASAGQLLRLNDTGDGIVGYTLISGVGSQEILSETTETAVLAYSTHTVESGTASSTLTYTSTATEDLTSSFSTDDLIYFSGNFTGSLATTYGTSTTGFLFALPIASPITGSSGSWTIVLDLNRAPFAAWVDATTVNLVNIETGVTITESGATAQFFTDAVDATDGLEVSLRTSTTVSEISIDTYADGDLEIAGINADGVVIALTEGDFGTAGQNVVVGTDGTSLTFADGVNPTSGTVPVNDSGAFVDSVITQASVNNEGTIFNTVSITSVGEGGAQNSLNVNGTTISESGAISGVTIGTQEAAVDLSTLSGTSPAVAFGSTIRPVNRGAAGQVLGVNSTGNTLEWINAGLTNNATANNIPIWDGDSFEDSAITQGLIDIFNNNTISNIQTFVDGLSVIFTKTNAATESGNSISNGNIVKFSTGLQGGFNGFSSTSLPFLDNAIGTVSNVSGQVITVSFSTALAGAFDFNDTLDGGGNTLVINENNVSPVFVDGDLSITGDITGNLTGNLTGNVTGGIDVDEAGAGSAAGTYEFRIADSGNTGAAGFITFVRE